MKLRGRVQLLVTVCLLLCSFSPGAAQNSTPPPDADDRPNRAIAFYPEESGQGSFITVELDAGESTTVNVILGNAGEIHQEFRAYAIPAVSATNGGFDIEPYGTELDEVTGWINFPEQTFSFEPTEGIILPVEISIPEGTPPGEYVTSLAAEQADSFEILGSETVRQRVRWSIPILVTVPGERTPAFQFGEEAHLEDRDGVMIATLGIVNTGNVIVRPEGEIRILDEDGAVLGVAKVTLGSIYTGTQTTFITAWNNVPDSSSYSLSATLTAENGTIEVSEQFDGLTPTEGESSQTEAREPLVFTQAEMTPLTSDEPPSTLQFDGEISNSGEVIENARVSIVTYQDGVEVDRYPIMQAVTIQQGSTPVQARYSLPGGFTEGTYTFEVTIEIGSGSTQTVLVTQPIEYEITVGD